MFPVCEDFVIGSHSWTTERHTSARPALGVLLPLMLRHCSHKRSCRNFTGNVTTSYAGKSVEHWICRHFDTGSHSHMTPMRLHHRRGLHVWLIWIEAAYVVTLRSSSTQHWESCCIKAMDAALVSVIIRVDVPSIIQGQKLQQHSTSSSFKYIYVHFREVIMKYKECGTSL